MMFRLDTTLRQITHAGHSPCLTGSADTSPVSLLFSAGLALSSLQQEMVSSPHVQNRTDSAVASLDQAVHELRSLAFASIDP
jgi:hypothetical protein